MTRPRLGAGLLILLVATGCTAAEPTPAPAPTTASLPPTTTPTTVASSATPSPTPSVLHGTVPVADCLRHRYRLTAFTALSDASPYRSGRGGDVDIAFTGGIFPDGAYVGTHFTLTGGRRPLSVTTADGAGELRVDGRVRGTYTLASNQAIFTQDTFRGSSTRTVGGVRSRAKLTETAAVLAPDGPTDVVCTSTRLQLTGTDVVLDLRRL